MRDLTGDLVFHNDLRQWFELKLSAPVCGERSIELVTDERGWRDLQTLRECKIETSGFIQIPLTGYYSAALFQYITKIAAGPDCVRKRTFPDYSKLKPRATVDRYRVAMRIHYQTDGPLEVKVTSEGRILRPWQVYARYFLTGGFAYYAYCGKGFQARNVRGNPEGKPWIMDNEVAFDPESVPTGVDPLWLSYDCRRITRRR